MTSKLNSLIVKIVDKKKGIKLADLVKYLESKADSIKDLGTVNFAVVKAAVTALFSAGSLDLIEYKLPGEDEKNRMFCIPVGSAVMYSEQNVAEEIVIPEPVVETRTALPADLFKGYVIIGEKEAEFLESPAEAQAYFLSKEIQAQSPRLYGAVPIQLEITPLLRSVQNYAPIEVVDTTTVSYPGLIAEVASAAPAVEADTLGTEVAAVTTPPTSAA